MHALKQEATNFRNAIKSRDLNYLIDSIKTGWEFKKQTSRAVSNEKINSIYEIAMANGALAGKVSGAGGGGFMWFYADINKKIQLMNKLRSLDGDVSSCHFTHQGAESWVV
jgi:D-glycero-alpha-D-manno-heptose-7-phosphate kinase